MIVDQYCTAYCKYGTNNVYVKSRYKSRVLDVLGGTRIKVQVRVETLVLCLVYIVSLLTMVACFFGSGWEMFHFFHKSESPP